MYTQKELYGGKWLPYTCILNYVCTETVVESAEIISSGVSACRTILLVHIVCRASAELRNVKKITQIKPFKPNFTLRKARESRQIKHLN